MKPRVAFIGTGGTIASLGRGPLDLQDYATAGTMLEADALLARFPEVQTVAEVTPVRFRAVPSTRIGWAEWRELGLLCDRLVADDPGLAGIVIGHGTASLEETAYALSLTLRVPVPVVVVGAQRPASALSSDAGLNLVNAVRVAASVEARGLGTLVLLNDEIHAAREVTKTSTSRLQTFRTADFGCLGHADGDRLAWYRRPVREAPAGAAFDIGAIPAPPRVDVVYAHADADGVPVRACVAAGARGLVAAGFAPGFVTPEQAAALIDAADAGVIVAISTRAGSGRVFPTMRIREAGFLTADNLTPQKARILLAMVIATGGDATAAVTAFARY